jgi:hypothetical protein
MLRSNSGIVFHATGGNLFHARAPLSFPPYELTNQRAFCPQPPQFPRLRSFPPPPIVETFSPAIGTAFVSVCPSSLVTMMHTLVLLVWGVSSPHQEPQYHNSFCISVVDDCKER